MNESNNFLFNRNLLPSLCFSTTLSKVAGLYNVKLVFNDYQRTAVSSLFYEATRFSFRLYRIEFKDESTPQNPIDMGTFVSIKSPPHLLYTSNDNVRLTDLIEFNDMQPGRYVLEMSVKQAPNEMCPNENECVDESNKNNKFQCVKCNKILTVFTLKKETIVSSQYSTYLPLHKKFTHCSHGNFKASVSASIDYGMLRKSNEKYLCSFTSLYAPVTELENKKRLNNFRETYTPLRTSDHIYSLVVAGDFNLSSFKLPFNHVDVGSVMCGEEDDSPLAIIAIIIVYFGLFFLPLLSIVFVSIVVYLCLIVCMEYKIRSKNNMFNFNFILPWVLV